MNNYSNIDIRQLSFSGIPPLKNAFLSQAFWKCTHDFTSTNKKQIIDVKSNLIYLVPISIKYNIIDIII